MKFIYILLWIGIAIAAFFLVRALRIIVIGFVRLVKNYRKLGKKEFMERLNEGVQKITPTQKVRAELNGLIINMIGMIAGLVATPIFKIQGVWFWVEIILAGSLLLTGFQFLGKWQMYILQKKQDEIMRKLESGEEIEIE